jgi:hypothetical protein
MNTIIPSNPYVPPRAHPLQVTGEAPNPLAVTAPHATSAGAGAADARSSAGARTDAQSHGQDGSQLYQRIKQALSAANRPHDASRSSVVAAQVHSARNAEGPPQGDDPMALPDNFPFHKKLPEVKMPDPLPTSPFLKRA